MARWRGGERVRREGVRCGAEARGDVVRRGDEEARG